MRLLLAATVVVATALGSGAAPVVASDRGAAPPSDRPVAQVATDRPGGAGNNTTELHEDPAAVEPVRTAPALRAALLGRMSGTLNESVRRLDLRDYDRAARLLDERYAANLSRYRTVAADLDEEETAALYEDLGATQRTVIEDAREAERLGRQYAAAERNGSDARARRLARRLIDRSRAVSANTTRLVRTYERAENRSGVDYAAEIGRLESFQTRVANASARVRAREFDSTALAVETNRTTASFTDPVRVSGRLTAGNATGVTNRTVDLRVGARTYTVETNATGAFALAYRPVLAPVNASTLTVRYLPRERTLYLPTNATTPLRVRQTNATLTGVRATTPVAFEDRLRVRGAVVVDGRRVAGVPLRISVDETRLATTDLRSNGTFRARATVPAGVPSGTRRLAVRGPPGRAVRVDGVRSLAVAETPTTLSGSVARRNASRAVVTGRLATADGRALGNRTLRVRIGRRERTVETGANGSYRVRADLTLGRLDTPRDEVRVVYPGTGSNLARARAVVPVPPRPTASSFEDVDDLTLAELARAVLFSDVTLGLGALLAGLGVLGGVVRLYRRRRTASADLPDEPTAAGTTDDGADEAESDDAADESGRPPDDPSTHPYAAALGDARLALSTGATDVVVLRSYGVVWAVLRELCDADAPTHWELYAAAVEDDRPPADPLRRLTETYERTAYGGTGADRESAGAALADAEAVLTSLDPGALPDAFDPAAADRPPGYGSTGDPGAE